MSLERGFDTDLFVYYKVGTGSAKWYKVCTVGDMSYTNSRTAIEVRNRASEKVRIIGGMQTWNISIQVQKGTDPEDTQDGTGFDFAACLLTCYQQKKSLYFNFGGTLTNGTISGGETELLICTNMSPNAEVDGLYTYTADLGISAIHADTALTPANVSAAALPNSGGGVTPGETTTTGGTTTGGTTTGGTTTGGDGTGGNDSGTDGDIQTEGNPSTTNP